MPDFLCGSLPDRLLGVYLRRSLLVQLVSVYLLFVVVVLVAGAGVNAVVEQRVRGDAQAADQALAQEIAGQTSARMSDALSSLQGFSTLALRASSSTEMKHDFESFMYARSDILHVSWLNSFGSVLVSVDRTSPAKPPTPDTSNPPPEFSPPSILLAALDQDARFECLDSHDPRKTNGPVYEAGIAQETTNEAGVIFVQPVDDVAIPTVNCRDPHIDPHQHLVGFIAMSISLGQLSTPLQDVVSVQRRQHRTLKLSIVDNNGLLVASSDTSQASGLLINLSGDIPGIDQALQGTPASQIGPGAGGQDWLYSAVPVPRTGWMSPDARTGWVVIAQRPTGEALAVVTQLHAWLLIAAMIFAVGGLVFWLLLLDRVIRPLHALAIQHQAFPNKSHAAPEKRPGGPDHAAALARREDEVGALARSVERLEHDVLAQLGELHTLLETSNAVVTSLDPRAVGRTIIHEVRRLVDVQAAAVLVPDETGTLHVLVSEGRDRAYDDAVSVRPDDLDFPAARALHDGRPVQMLADGVTPFPPLSLSDGFRAVLAVPIISRHAGGVVLLVHRVESQPFTAHEVDLLLTFANYATLAWEHAVLYERSDERLREVAQENERLYHRAVAETQTLSALMGSMSDGLVLTGADGRVLYANRGASAITALPVASLEGSAIAAIHTALRAAAEQPEQYDSERARAESGEITSWLLETRRERRSLAINLRLFDVRDDAGAVVGRGLLLRDVTREHEVDRFKTTLLAAVGHELRTPLSAIKGHASTLLQEDVTWTSGEQRHFLQTISDEANRLAQMVTNLLDLSRLEAGLLALHRAPWELADLITGAASRLGTQLPALQIDIPPYLPPLEVDATRIEVVLQNLIANALTYGSGAVRISAERQGDLALVHVSDEGAGISREDLPHIFERFYRASRDQLRHSGGTGLGLAISKAFVEAHGGTIWAESGVPATESAHGDGNGHGAPRASGTTISFTLPLAARSTIPLPQAQPAAAGQPASPEGGA